MPGEAARPHLFFGQSDWASHWSVINGAYPVFFFTYTYKNARVFHDYTMRPLNFLYWVFFLQIPTLIVRKKLHYINY